MKSVDEKYDDFDITRSLHQLDTSPHGGLATLDTTHSRHTTRYCRLPMATPHYRELVGVPEFLDLGIRPDIAFATGSLARFGHNPGRVHWEAAKRVLRYLKGTRGWRLTLGGKTVRIAGYTDADWGSDRDDRRSIGAYIVKIGDDAVSWKSNKQSYVAILTEPVPVGAGSGAWRITVLVVSHNAVRRKGRKDLVSKRTGTLVDPQTEELATGYTGLNNRNRI